MIGAEKINLIPTCDYVEIVICGFVTLAASAVCLARAYNVPNVSEEIIFQVSNLNY